MSSRPDMAGHTMAFDSLRFSDPRRPRVKEHCYLFLCHLLDHIGRVDFSRNLAHVSRLKFSSAFKFNASYTAYVLFSFH